jgi:RNA polymerase sigma factor for flagellar operon FliA
MNGNQFDSPNDTVRQQQITAQMPLVKYCVSRMHVNKAHLLDYEDLVAHGTLGLIQAVDRFDGGMGTKFSSFALPRIRGAVLDAMRSIDPVGRTTRQAGSRIAKEFNSLALELERNPTPNEVQTASHITEGRYWEALAATEMRKVSIDATTDDGLRISDRLDDGSAALSDAVENEDVHFALVAAVRSLSERDRLVLRLYYGEDLTLKSTAQVMHLSEARVSQLLARAYTRLRADRSLADAAQPAAA